MLRAQLPLSCVLVSCSCVLICSLFGPLVGAPNFPFYRQRKSAGYSGGKGEGREREKKASRIAGSFFPFMRVLPIL